MEGRRSSVLLRSLLASSPRNWRKSLTFASLNVLRMVALCCGVMLACAGSVTDERLARIRVDAASCLSEKSIAKGIPLQAVSRKCLIDASDGFAN